MPFPVWKVEGPLAPWPPRFRRLCVTTKKKTSIKNNAIAATTKQSKAKQSMQLKAKQSKAEHKQNQKQSK